jgi:hypothetical protein
MRGAALAVLAGAVLAYPATAQLIDSTLGDIIAQQIDQQVENEVAEALAGAVQSEVAQQVEADVAAAVQEQVEAEVANTVAQQVSAEVANTIQQQVAAEVADSVQQQLESGVTDALAQALEGTVADAVADGIVDTVGAAADLLDAGGEIVPSAASSSESPGAPNERFFAAVDALGRSIERAVWVVLVPSQFADQIPGWGFTIRERRDLAGLGRVLLRVDAPEDRGIAQAALELALDAPGTLVDFNHVYRGTEEPALGPQTSSLAAKPGAAAGAARAQAALAIGVIDTQVSADHEALRGADIVQRDFVPFAGPRPTGHGTSVASILVGEGRALEPRLSGGRLYAATVFFEDAEGEPGATTASLVAALGWLAAEGVRVMNMSLSGPPNRVLEAAVGDAAAGGAVIVAAVGNNGPVGEPLYPAAYRPVIGVTAVDGANHVYRYANRGKQVMFAAPGVRIKVARSGGGFATATGTSMAAPYATAIIARALAADLGQPANAVLSTLQAAAIDLGAKDFDDVYGFGLIAATE